MGACLMIACLLISSTTVYASSDFRESNNDSNIPEIISPVFTSVENEERLFPLDSSLSTDEEVELQNRSGDQYESNDSIATATNGLQGQVVNATIHSATDVDFYKFEVLNNDPISILLYNIPYGCDYDLYLFNSDQSGWYTDFQDGTTAETFYIYLDDPGTYYVAVDSYSGYSDSPYSLYFGKSYVDKGTEWMDPNMSFPFGNVPYGTTKTLAAQNFNLTNNNSIPDGAVVTSFHLTSHGTGGTYGGFTKYVKPGNGATVSALGGIEVITLPPNTLVKQNWQIWGSVQYSNYFTWEPQILIQYQFFVTPITAHFV